MHYFLHFSRRVVEIEQPNELDDIVVGSNYMRKFLDGEILAFILCFFRRAFLRLEFRVQRSEQLEFGLRVKSRITMREDLGKHYLPEEGFRYEHDDR